MNLETTINNRQSIRKYKLTNIDNQIPELINAFRKAPSSCNRQAWKIKIIKQKREKRWLTQNNGGKNWANKAPTILMILTDTRPYKTKTEKKSMYIDIGCAIQNLILKATEQKLGTCIITYENKNKKTNKRYNLPNYYEIPCLITIGKPNEKPKKLNKKTIKEILDLNDNNYQKIQNRIKEHLKIKEGK